VKVTKFGLCIVETGIAVLGDSVDFEGVTSRFEGSIRGGGNIGTTVNSCKTNVF
jgi:hypothetical protein